MQGDVRGVGHIRSVMAESSFTRHVHDSQHVLLGTKVQILAQIRAAIVMDESAYMTRGLKLLVYEALSCWCMRP